MTIVGAMGLIGMPSTTRSWSSRRWRRTKPPRAEVGAAVLVVRRASRHAISTSLTTIAGFAPLILAGGAFWPPLAIAIAGGVLGATLIAVTLVPAAHGVVARRVRPAPPRGPKSRAARSASPGA